MLFMLMLLLLLPLLQVPCLLYHHACLAHVLHVAVEEWRIRCGCIERGYGPVALQLAGGGCDCETIRLAHLLFRFRGLVLSVAQTACSR